MARPRRKDRFDEIELKCIICKRTFKREKYLEESRIQQGKLGPVCSSTCSGRLGWKVKQSLERESHRIQED